MEEHVKDKHGNSLARLLARTLQRGPKLEPVLFIVREYILAKGTANLGNMLMDIWSSTTFRAGSLK